MGSLTSRIANDRSWLQATCTIVIETPFDAILAAWKEEKILSDEMQTPSRGKQ